MINQVFCGLCGICASRCADGGDVQNRIGAHHCGCFSALCWSRVGCECEYQEQQRQVLWRLNLFRWVFSGSFSHFMWAVVWRWVIPTFSQERISREAAEKKSGTIKTDFWRWNNNCSVSFVKSAMLSSQVTEGFPIPKNRTGALNMAVAKKPSTLTNIMVVWTVGPSSRCKQMSVTVGWKGHRSSGIAVMRGYMTGYGCRRKMMPFACLQSGDSEVQKAERRTGQSAYCASWDAISREMLDVNCSTRGQPRGASLLLDPNWIKLWEIHRCALVVTKLFYPDSAMIYTHIVDKLQWNKLAACIVM